MINKKLISSTIKYFLLSIVGFMMVFPLLWMFLSSFKHSWEILAFPPTVLPKEMTLINYINAWEKVNFITYFKNSVFLTVVKTALIVYTSALTGYVLCKFKFKYRTLLFYFILATMMVPWPVLIVPLYQEMTWFGWIGSYKSLIIPQLLSSYGIFLMRQFVISIPNELIESARIDGSNEFGIFHKIMLPNMGNAISALGIFVFLWTWEDFLWPYLMLSNETKYTLPIGIAMLTGSHWADTATILAGSSISIIPVLIIYIIMQKRFVEGIVLSGLKV